LFHDNGELPAILIEVIPEPDDRFIPPEPAVRVIPPPTPVVVNAIALGSPMLDDDITAELVKVILCVPDEKFNPLVPAGDKLILPAPDVVIEMPPLFDVMVIPPPVPVVDKAIADDVVFVEEIVIVPDDAIVAAAVKLIFCVPDEKFNPFVPPDDKLILPVPDVKVIPPPVPVADKAIAVDDVFVDETVTVPPDAPDVCINKLLPLGAFNKIPVPVVSVEDNVISALLVKETPALADKVVNDPDEPLMGLLIIEVAIVAPRFVVPLAIKSVKLPVDAVVLPIGVALIEVAVIVPRVVVPDDDKVVNAPVLGAALPIGVLLIVKPVNAGELDNTPPVAETTPLVVKLDIVAELHVNVSGFAPDDIVAVPLKVICLVPPEKFNPFVPAGDKLILPAPDDVIEIPPVFDVKVIPPPVPVVDKVIADDDAFVEEIVTVLDA
jgi:hypothetical protein